MTSMDAKLVKDHDKKETSDQNASPNPGSSSTELCCLGPSHLLFGDTRTTNAYFAYFLKYVRDGMNEAMSSGSAGVVDLSIKKQESETATQRVRGEVENENVDTNRLMWVMLSVMLTVLCWVPGIVFNLVLCACCVGPLHTEKDQSAEAEV
ncbi:hypothetical protein C9374_004474 [Naegleria lovaniensis]|uniref:Uncharacterized protein n=1 Tax=Naegleria lovaniensis TaxID=51637 RepID=A0AA88GRR8_NAELO|nr:uncharacterized protein C9374_004474 [Naegleria lovaniensis]KAG2383137.1 hypothetical protein C9374_004474 [Naegleria lovaniensis]